MYGLHIYPLICGVHVGCFHILAVVNGAAVKIVVHGSFGITVFLVCPGVGLQDHMVALFLGKRFQRHFPSC